MFKITAKTIADDNGESTGDYEVLALVRLTEDRVSDALGHKINEIEMQLPLQFEKLKYLTQIKTQPPSFLLFARHSKSLTTETTRFIRSQIQQEFKLWGFPINLSIRDDERKDDHR